MSKKVFFSLITFLILSGIFSTTGKAQNFTPFPHDSFSVKTINGIITSVYTIISGPAGERDWEKFKSLFAENARFISVKTNKEGKQEYFNGSVDDYIERIRDVLMEQTYYENEIERNIQESDGIAQVFSIYESVFVGDVPENYKGVNCFHLIYKDDRWYIVNIIFNSEPTEY